jgi:catechol 2,3-dioxygenase-like lactoylglutathione lyase family enzyme
VEEVLAVLENLATIGFIPASDLSRSRVFYAGTLGLTFVSEDGFALVFRAGDRMLRVVAAGEFTPQPFTVFGWEAPDIDATVDDLTARGVEFLRYPHIDQDERGIWIAPGGIRVAWFNDPDGNVLSLSAHHAA